MVNGTFTENGGTEILKMYEVGSIIDSVPAVRADRGYEKPAVGQRSHRKNGGAGRHDLCADLLRRVCERG